MKKPLSFPARLALVILSGTLIPFCFPPYGYWPLLLIALPALLFATTDTKPRRAFYLGLTQGVIAYASSLYWLYNVFSVVAISLFVILGLFTALFCLLFNSASKQTTNTTLRTLLAATLWTAIEFYRSELFILRFPWITPGSALGPTLLSPVVGVYGTTFLIVAAAAAFLSRKTLPLAGFLALCVICLGIFHPVRLEPDAGKSFAVTVVQNEGCDLQTYAKMTRTALKDSPNLIIWPECAVPYDVREFPDEFTSLTTLCGEMEAILIIGTQTKIGLGAANWHNTALILDKKGVVGEYYKARPVHFFDDGIPGDNFTPTQTILGRVGTPICFDNDYTEVTQKMASLGAEFFAAPSFDAISWSVTQHLQHGLLFRLRAAETGRWIACAASSGASQFIDPNGNVHTSIPPMETGIKTYRIASRDGKTLFVRAGWLFPWLTLIATGFFLAFAAIKGIMKKAKDNPPDTQTT